MRGTRTGGLVAPRCSSLLNKMNLQLLQNRIAEERTDGNIIIPTKGLGTTMAKVLNFLGGKKVRKIILNDF